MCICLCDSVGSDGKLRQLTSEDCCPRREEHQVIYQKYTGMIPNYTGHLPGRHALQSCNDQPLSARLILQRNPDKSTKSAEHL